MLNERNNFRMPIGLLVLLVDYLALYEIRLNVCSDN